MLLHSDNMQNPLDTLQTPQTQHRHPPERQYLKALVASNFREREWEAGIPGNGKEREFLLTPEESFP